MASYSLEELKGKGKAAVPAPAADVAIGFSTVAGVEALQRMAKTFAYSPITPDTFRVPYMDSMGKAKGCSSEQEAIGSCSIALDMAIRMAANPLMVMQNLYVVHGRPAWSAKFLLATLLKSGRYNGIHYDFSGTENTDEWGCALVAIEVATGMEVRGPRITIALAKAEGWFGKSGSKWRTMPEMMLRYRAVSWFVQTYCPDIAMGLPEAEEARDIIDITPVQEEAAQEEKPAITLEQVEQKAKRGRKPKAAPAPAVEAEVVSEMETPEQPIPQEEETQEYSEGFLCPENGAVVDNSVCDRCQLREGCSVWGVSENVVPE